ncbi:MAG: VWA domain-containing protein [Chloroflexi bacterium]|nr:VWA domain-containing protein [Chloroflexota bacterium]
MIIAIATGVIGTTIAALIVLYLTSPHYTQFPISSAVFFQVEERAPDIQVPRWRTLRLTWIFVLQCMTLVMLLIAAICAKIAIDIKPQQEHVGVWITLDTSASMSTLEGSQTRIDLACRQVERLVTHLNKLDSDVCIDFYTFDLGEKNIQPNVSPDAVLDAVSGIQHRPLGTDVGLVRGLIERSIKRSTESNSDSSCPATHVLVVTDMPAPVWINEESLSSGDVQTTTQTIWLDVATQVDNVGIVNVQRTGTVFNTTGEIKVELAAYGSIPLETTLTVTDERNDEMKLENVNWDRLGRSSLLVSLPRVGHYTLALSKGGAYSLDDQVTIAYDLVEQIRADWQLEDKTLLDTLGWQPDASDPHIRIISYPGELESDDVPVLLVGSGYGQGSIEAGKEIRFFFENPLLDGINFDVAERLDIQGISLPEDDPLRSVLYDNGGLTWFAASNVLPAAYVPGLPVSDSDENLEAFSNTAFFNALRWLLGEYTPAPLYTLTSSQHPTREGNRSALHPGEGYTYPPRSDGRIEDIQPLRAAADTFPLWLILITLATLFLTIERILTLSRWTL